MNLINQGTFSRIIFRMIQFIRFGNIFAMNDRFVTLALSLTWRRLVTTLRLPVTLPLELKRAFHTVSPNELNGRRVLVHSRPAATRLQTILASASAEIQTAVRPGGQRNADCQGLVLEISVHDKASSIHKFYDVATRALNRLGRNAPIVVVTRSEGSALSEQALIYRAAVAGLIRSLARELDPQGSTVNLPEIPDEQTAPPDPLIFLLSDHCTCITGQMMELIGTATDFADIGNQPLSVKQAVVTGAGCGIGWATAPALAREGASVIAVDRRDNPALATLTATPRIDRLSLDINEKNAAERFVSSELGGIDILVHHAGITRNRALKKMSREEWHEVLEVNLLAPLRLTDEIMQTDLLLRGSRIITLSSIAGIAGELWPDQIRHRQGRSDRLRAAARATTDRYRHGCQRGRASFHRNPTDPAYGTVGTAGRPKAECADPGRTTRRCSRGRHVSGKSGHTGNQRPSPSRLRGLDHRKLK